VPAISIELSNASGQARGSVTPTEIAAGTSASHGLRHSRKLAQARPT
jgi:hypothetical protein